MKRIHLILAVLLVFGWSSVVFAEDTPASESKIEKKEQKQKQEQKQEQKKDQKKEQKQERTEFVDRNGDGIQDGQEHRFRGKHRRRGKAGADEGGDGERRRRARGSSRGRQ
jgi:nitrate reductase cytochrome c-type subunit